MTTRLQQFLSILGSKSNQPRKFHHTNSFSEVTSTFYPTFRLYMHSSLRMHSSSKTSNVRDGASSSCEKTHVSAPIGARTGGAVFVVDDFGKPIAKKKKPEPGFYGSPPIPPDVVRDVRSPRSRQKQMHVRVRHWTAEAGTTPEHGLLRGLQ